MNLNDLTPVQEFNGWFLKRDDLFEVFGVCGGKARACYAIMSGEFESAGLLDDNPGKYNGFVTAGSRQSPQINICARIAEGLGKCLTAFTPEGELSPELEEAEKHGAKIIQVPAGYNTVIISRAKDYATSHNFFYIPFGMEDSRMFDLTASQVQNIPDTVRRIVMPVGSGVSMIGVMKGLKEFGKNAKILGVVVGGEPVKRLDKHMTNWRSYAGLTNAVEEYHMSIQREVNGIKLDPIYEAKCVSQLHKGNLFWIVGRRNNI